MTQEEMIKKLRGYIYTNFRTASEYAFSKNVSGSYVSAVLTGIKEPSQDILDDINVTKEKTVVYIEKKK